MRVTSYRLAGAAALALSLIPIPQVAGQEEPPIPAPPKANTAADLESATLDFDVLARGPLHEAFARPVSLEPITGPFVRRQPPEPIDEIPPETVPSGNRVVWVSGYWAWDNELDDFLWVSGIWRDAPPGRAWIGGYWSQVDGGYQWVPGVWADETLEQLVYLPSPGRSRESGPTGAPLQKTDFWIPGVWEYTDAGYRWRDGYWAPPESDWVWIPAQFARSPAGYLFVSGYWDYPLAERGVVFAPVRFQGLPPTRFTPRVAVDTWHTLMLHLFVEPRFSTYVFGNYYGSAYAQAGLVPWHAYHRSGRGYDPLIVHYSRRYGDDFLERLQGWSRYFAGNARVRPQPIWKGEQRVDPVGAEKTTPPVNLLRPLSELSQLPDSPVAFSRMDTAQRNDTIARIRQQREFGRERIRVESPVAATEAGAERTTLKPEPRVLRFPRTGRAGEETRRPATTDSPNRRESSAPDDGDQRRLLPRPPTREPAATPDRTAPGLDRVVPSPGAIPPARRPGETPIEPGDRPQSAPESEGGAVRSPLSPGGRPGGEPKR